MENLTFESAGEQHSPSKGTPKPGRSLPSTQPNPEKKTQHTCLGPWRQDRARCRHHNNGLVLGGGHGLDQVVLVKGQVEIHAVKALTGYGGGAHDGHVSVFWHPLQAHRMR